MSLNIYSFGALSTPFEAIDFGLFDQTFNGLAVQPKYWKGALRHTYKYHNHKAPDTISWYAENLKEDFEDGVEEIGDDV